MTSRESGEELTSTYEIVWPSARFGNYLDRESARKSFEVYSAGGRSAISPSCNQEVRSGVICRLPFRPVRDANGMIVGNSGCDYNADGYNFDYPNTPSFGNALRGLSRSDYINGLFSASDFPAPALGMQGDLGRNTFVGPGYANTDFSFLKSFLIPWFVGDGAQLQFRAEFFNTFNRVNLSAPVGELSSPLFGRSTSTFAPRNIQFALRLAF